MAPWPRTLAATRDGGGGSVACDHGWSRKKDGAVRGEEDAGGVSLAQRHRQRQERCSTELGPASMAASRSWALERWRGEEASGEWRGNGEGALVLALIHTDTGKGEVEVAAMVGQVVLHGDHVAISSNTWRATK